MHDTDGHEVWEVDEILENAKVNIEAARKHVGEVYTGINRSI